MAILNRKIQLGIKQFLENCNVTFDMLSFIECLKHAYSEGNIVGNAVCQSHKVLVPIRLKTPRLNRGHSSPPPPTFPLPFPFNHCEALIWSHELHTRCVDFIANISGPQLGPKKMLMESVAFQYSEILMEY